MTFDPSAIVAESTLSKKLEGSYPYFLINLSISKTNKYYEFLDSKASLPTDPDNVFGTKESALGLAVASKLVESKLVKNCSSYMSNLCLYFESSSLSIENTACQVSIVAYKALSHYYSDPSVSLTVYPAYDDNNKLFFQRYWQKAWMAHQVRALAEVYLEPPIPRDNKLYKVRELRDALENTPSFSFSNLSGFQKYSHHFVDRKLTTVNFFEGTQHGW